VKTSILITIAPAATHPLFRAEVNVPPGGVPIPWKLDGNGKWVDLLRLEANRSDGKDFVHLTYDTTVGLWSEVVTMADGG
jgi:hypothetical protein